MPAYICVKRKRNLPEICEEDFSDGTESHRDLLPCDSNLWGECGRSKCTSLSGQRSTHDHEL